MMFGLSASQSIPVNRKAADVDGSPGLFLTRHPLSFILHFPPRSTVSVLLVIFFHPIILYYPLASPGVCAVPWKVAKCWPCIIISLSTGWSALNRALLGPHGCEGDPRTGIKAGLQSYYGVAPFLADNPLLFIMSGGRECINRIPNQQWSFLQIFCLSAY